MIHTQKLGIISLGCVMVILGMFTVPDTAHAQYRGYHWRNTNADNGGSEEDADQTFLRNGMSSTMRRNIEALDNDPVEELPIPVLLGIKLSQIPDSWGDARDSGRTHEGTDILAPRNSFVVSPTDAVVTRIGEGGNGGIYVYTANPGDEEFYFAHLDHVNEDLNEGDVLEPGDLIGYVGNTGNAAGGPTHLHLGIYENNHDAINPYPRLDHEFSLEDRMDAIQKILNDSDDEDELAEELVINYRSTFAQAQAEDIDLPKIIEEKLGETIAVSAHTVTRTLRRGLSGDDVVWLQESLIKENVGSKAKALKASGADGSFGPITLAAVIEYQADNDLVADGVAGPKTRAALNEDGY